MIISHKKPCTVNGGEVQARRTSRTLSSTEVILNHPLGGKSGNCRNHHARVSGARSRNDASVTDEEIVNFMGTKAGIGHRGSGIRTRSTSAQHVRVKEASHGSVGRGFPLR